MTVIQPVILSGGAGTRLWPASRAMYPKQLLPLVSERTMLQETALRIRGGEGMADDVLVICNDAHRFLVAEQLREIEAPARIVLEPEGRNTAPAMALAALLALKDRKEGADVPLLLVMPADHVIKDPEAFLNAVHIGTKSAEHGRLITFGVVPTHPNIGYGYLESDSRALIAAPVRSFVEKPDKQTAVNLLETNRFFWNAGIFLLRADTYLDELGKYAPEILISCKASMAKATYDSDFIRPDQALFMACPSNSIDYAVMEKTDCADMVPLDAGWSDVGSWAALHEISDQDHDGNALSGDVIAVACKSSYISGKSRVVTALGVENLVIVEDKDSVLVVHKDESQRVGELVDELKRRGREEATLHRQVFRPWGSYDSIDSAEGFQVKRLIVNPGAVLSLQKHAQRAEHWVVVRGTARITLDDKVFDLAVNESTYIPIGAVHRIENPFDDPVHIIEVQCGEYLGEDDIVRLEDSYGREGTNT
jgi:mannose-1-phosphate guanylyltransferase/mannose-6-phosphate isomerase